MKNVTHSAAASAAVIASIAAPAVNLAKADKAFESALPTAASAVAKILGEKPSYDHWVTVQDAFISAYMKERGCTESTATNRFSSVAVAMKNSFALEKPAKPTAAAAKKAASRAKQATSKASLKAECHNVADAVSKATKALESGDVQKAIAYQAVATELQKSAETVAQKAAREALTVQRDKIRKAITECTDLAALKKAYEIIVGNVPAVEPVKTASKASKAPKVTKSKASPFDALTTPALM